MKKCRLIYFIFSILISMIILSLSIYFQKFVFLTSIITFSILLSNLQKKKNEIDEIKKIILEFNMQCDTDIYLYKLNDFRKKCFFNKKQEAYFNLYIVAGEIEKGNFDIAKKILLEIDKYNEKFNLLARFIYLKTWCNLFFHENLNEKMKIMLLKLREIIDVINNPQMKIALLQSYQIEEVKYFILVNREIDKIKTFFIEKRKRERFLLHKINYTYYQALCDFRNNDLSGGISLLKEITDMNKDLHICDEANKMLKTLEFNK